MPGARGWGIGVACRAGAGDPAAGAALGFCCGARGRLTGGPLRGAAALPVWGVSGRLTGGPLRGAAALAPGAITGGRLPNAAGAVERGTLAPRDEGGRV